MQFRAAVFLFLIGFWVYEINAQRPKRLLDEVQELQAKYDTLYTNGKKTYVFAGSSSIRFWEELPEIFSEVQVVNSGFGGSMASDLLVYLDELVLDYKPDKVFLYEGDNDIFNKKSPAKIVRQTRRIVRRIQKYNGPTPVVIIGAKPSLVRWHLKKKYEKLNAKLKALCEQDIRTSYVHIWDSMLEDGTVKKEIFLEDGLHMNEQGYSLWKTIIKPFGN
ncbi:MAG: G-D-S-L family lipolytic protein [Bacteroidia bacterium]|nr:G-D-S-L family lipolytic protein [Bacteroidia bacterium]